jgi:tripartite-type tricarboxylate transporter receptor subunit TctC
MKLPHRRQFLHLAAGAAALPAVSRVARAQTYPTRPIRLVVPSAAGGVNDIAGRLWADKVRGALGTIVIENRGGAGGTVGVTEVARASPDGHTLLLGGNGTHILHPLITQQPAYDAINDFEVVAVFAVSSTSVVVNPTIPAGTLKELVDYVKANPGKLSYAIASFGGLSHVAGEMFKYLAGGLQMTAIPYRGGGPALNDVISGILPLMFPNVTGQVVELHRTGKIRVLAVNAPSRLDAIPDIPTAIEAGVAGMVSQNFFALFAPARTPRSIIDRLDEATQKAMSDKEFQKNLVDAGFEPVAGFGPEKSTAYIKSEYARWEPIIKAANIKAE